MPRRTTPPDDHGPRDRRGQDTPLVTTRALGFEHPLSCLARRWVVVRRQTSSVGLVLVGSGLVAAVTGASWTRSLVLAAAIVFAALLALAAMVHHATRREARVLIMDGGENVPLRAVARERRRLLSARSREQLASRFEAYARAASGPSRLPWGAPYPFADLLAVRAVYPDCWRSQLWSASCRAVHAASRARSTFRVRASSSRTAATKECCETSFAE